MKYEMSEQMIKNIMAIINKSDLKGYEIPAYLDIINALNTPIKEEPKPS